MVLENESSVLDNGVVSVSANVNDDDETKTIDFDQQFSNSPVETCTPVSKGFGLRKWKRLKRRDLVKDVDTLVNSKILKRVLSGTSDSCAKQMHFQSPDVEQDSLGSVGSVNGSGSSCGISLSLLTGIDSDNSEDHRSSKSSTAASGRKVRSERTAGHSWDKHRSKYLGGKSVISFGESGKQRRSSVEKSKKFRGERIKIEKENSHSSMESADSRSSNFVFVQGASSSLSSREQGGRRMTDYNEENSDHGAHTNSRKDNVGEESDGYAQGDFAEVSQIKNNGSSEDLDPLDFKSFQNLQEALKRELQKFQELGREEPVTLLHDGAESISCIHEGLEASPSRWLGSENLGELGSTSRDSEVLNLMNNVEHLEIKLEETKCILEVKESQIRELESTTRVSESHNRGTEIRIEDIFRQKMEAEIEYLIFSRSVGNLKTRIKLIEEEKSLAENEARSVMSKLGKAETKAKNLENQAQDLQNHCVEIKEVKSFKKRVFKTMSCLLLQLSLLSMLFSFQLMPESETVVPT